MLNVRRSETMICSPERTNKTRDVWTSVAAKPKTMRAMQAQSTAQTLCIKGDPQEPPTMPHAKGLVLCDTPTRLCAASDGQRSE